MRQVSSTGTLLLPPSSSRACAIVLGGGPFLVVRLDTKCESCVPLTPPPSFHCDSVVGFSFLPSFLPSFLSSFPQRKRPGDSGGRTHLRQGCHSNGGAFDERRRRGRHGREVRRASTLSYKYSSGVSGKRLAMCIRPRTTITWRWDPTCYLRTFEYAAFEL